MINEVVAGADFDLGKILPTARRRRRRLKSGNRRTPRVVTALENGVAPQWKEPIPQRRRPNSNPPSASPAPAGGQILLTDELVRRFRLDQADNQKIAIISIDPSSAPAGRSWATASA